MNKQQLITLKKLLCDYYKRTPRKLKTSTLTVGILDAFAVTSTLYILLENSSDFDLIIKNLLTSGLTTGTLIGLITCQKSIKKEEDTQNKNKVRKR